MFHLNNHKNNKLFMMSKVMFRQKRPALSFIVTQPLIIKIHHSTSLTSSHFLILE
jgi:hypothetical protein